jgi:hypothetical protein
MIMIKNNPISAALDRLQEYAAGNPNHDTDELVASARAELAAITELAPRVPLPMKHT